MPFCVAKQPVLECETGRFRLRNGPFRKAKRYVLEWCKDNSQLRDEAHGLLDSNVAKSEYESVRAATTSLSARKKQTADASNVAPAVWLMGLRQTC